MKQLLILVVIVVLVVAGIVFYSQRSKMAAHAVKIAHTVSKETKEAGKEAVEQVKGTTRDAADKVKKAAK